MEKQLLSEIFNRYLSGEASAKDIRLLLDHFALDKDSELLRQLIRDSYESEQRVIISPEDKHSLERIKLSLKERIAAQKSKSIYYLSWLKYSAAAIVLIAVGIAYFYRGSINDYFNPVRYQTVTTLKGQRKRLTLADGSIVWLAPQSSLRYPDAFRSNQREVKLSGEAFFEITKDRTHPFVVHSGKLDTKVLGTTFNIQAYDNEQSISVTLLTGKVALRTASGKTDQLLPDERAVFDKANYSLTKQKYTQSSQMLDRREGFYHYDGTPVLQILNDLRRDYNIPIQIEGDITNCTFYGDYHESDDPYIFLRKVCAVINAQFIKDETGIKIIGKGC